MLLDIQEIIAKGKGDGYERWAKVYNIKQVAKVLLFLQEHDCRDYETLAKRAEETSVRFWGRISFVSTFTLCANIMRFVTEMGNWNSLHFELSV